MAVRDLAALAAILAIRSVGGFDYQSAADALRSSNSFEVQEGSLRFLRQEGCRGLSAARPAAALSEGVAGVCYGNNPATPYGLLMLPREPGEVDEDRCSLLCEKGLSAAWRLGAEEAVVLLGLTPPECVDFGVAGYLFSRLHPEGWQPDSLAAEESASCPAGPARCELFASMSEPWSSQRLEPDRRFLAPFALVLAPSRAGSRAAVEALLGAGVPSEAIHELPFPGQELTLGLGAGADVLTSLLRMVGVVDRGALSRYLVETPIRVLRLSLKEPPKDISSDLFPRARLAVGQKVLNEGTPHKQMSLLEAGRELAALQHAVIADAGRELGFDYRIRVTEMSPRVPESGFECVSRGLSCRADWPGSLQLASHALAVGERECERLEENLRLRGSCRAVQRAKLPLEDTDFMVVLGVNHKALGLAKHMALSVYNLNTMESVKVMEEIDLNGTAFLYADPKREQRAKYLYAFKFMRRCPAASRVARSCFSVPSSGPAGVPLDAPLYFAEWAYGLPSGTTSDSLVPPRVIHFAAAGNPSPRKTASVGSAAKDSDKDGGDKEEI